MKRLSISLVVILILTLSIVVFVAYRLGDSESVVAQGFVESRMLRLGSKLAGRIDRLYVEEGDSVVQGDTLYIISTPELDAKLLQVEAMLDGAKAIEEKAKVGTRKPLVASAYDMWQMKHQPVCRRRRLESNRCYHISLIGIILRPFDSLERRVHQPDIGRTSALCFTETVGRSRNFHHIPEGHQLISIHRRILDAFVDKSSRCHADGTSRS